MCSTAGASRGELLCAIVSVSALKKALALAKATPQAMDMDALKMITDSLDGTYLDAVLEVALVQGDGPRKDLLFAYLARPGLGNESGLASRFPAASEEVGLALVRILAKLGDTREAKAALVAASQSPHGIVRIEALGLVEGASSDKMRTELRALLEDPDAGVRMTALRTMEKNAVRVAGPSLVMRIKSSKFDGLPKEEKKQAFRTLAILAPRRAEEVAVEVLSNAGLLPSEAHEQSRILAAELLGVVGQSEAAKEALLSAEGARWRSSEPLRLAAENARKRLVKMPPSPWEVPADAQAASRPSGTVGAAPSVVPQRRPSMPNVPSAPSVGPPKGDPKK
jgi:hypothetical protein